MSRVRLDQDKERTAHYRSFLEVLCCLSPFQVLDEQLSKDRGLPMLELPEDVEHAYYRPERLLED